MWRSECSGLVLPASLLLPSFRRLISSSGHSFPSSSLLVHTVPALSVPLPSPFISLAPFLFFLASRLSLLTPPANYSVVPFLFTLSFFYLFPFLSYPFLQPIYTMSSTAPNLPFTHFVFYLAALSPLQLPFSFSLLSPFSFVLPHSPISLCLSFILGLSSLSYITLCNFILLLLSFFPNLCASIFLISLISPLFTCLA